MSPLISVHQKLGVALLLVFLVGAALAVIATRQGRQLPAVRAYMRLCVAAAGLQVILGLVLLAIGRRPHDLLHYFYAAATLISLPIAVRLGRGEADRREAVFLAVGAVAAFLFTIRAIGTGG